MVFTTLVQLFLRIAKYGIYNLGSVVFEDCQVWYLQPWFSLPIKSTTLVVSHGTYCTYFFNFTIGGLFHCHHNWENSS